MRWRYSLLCFAIYTVLSILGFALAPRVPGGTYNVVEQVVFFIAGTALIATGVTVLWNIVRTTIAVFR